MEKFTNWLPSVSSATGLIGIAGGLISALFGGWSASMTVLVIFMLVDYVTGLVVAGIFHKSNKSDSGAISSVAGWKGLCRKAMTLIIVLITAQLDLLIGSSFVRDAVVIAYIANEAISIIENAGLMGVPIPEIITRTIEVLRTKAENEGK